jgi:ribosomal-protein-alanine N-acetyltransferase
MQSCSVLYLHNIFLSISVEKNMNKTIKFPVLETDRLLLRELTYGDIDVVFKHFSNEEVARYEDAHPARSNDEAREIIDWGKGLVEHKMGALWGIIRREDNSFLGQVNCVFRVNHNFAMNIHRAEIGYDLTPPYWGNGYMSEAIASVISYVFTSTPIDRLEAIIHPDNARSHNVVKKAGFLKEGVLRHYVLWQDEHWDMVLFSLLKQDWETGAR